MFGQTLRLIRDKSAVTFILLQGEDGEDGLNGVNGDQVPTSGPTDRLSVVGAG